MALEHDRLVRMQLHAEKCEARTGGRASSTRRSPPPSVTRSAVAIALSPARANAIRSASSDTPAEIGFQGLERLGVVVGGATLGGAGVATVATGIVAYSMLVAGFVMLGAKLIQRFGALQVRRPLTRMRPARWSLRGPPAKR